MTVVKSNIDRVWDDFFFGNRVAYTPEYDVLESKDSYSLLFDLPGITEDEISIEIKDRELNLEVTRDKKDEEVKYLVRNRKSYNFTKGFKLPDDVNRESVEASFKNGVLEIVIGKRDEVKPKKISINS